MSYNITALADAGNPVDMVTAINLMGNNSLLIAAYIAVGLLFILGIKSRFPIEIALTLGGFMASIVGAMMAVLGWIPIYAPFVFVTITFVGIILVTTGKGQAIG